MPDTDDGFEDFQDVFARIEAAVDGGDSDLSKLGFWRMVRRVKADPMLSQHWADVVGRIDRKAFEQRVHPRFPVWLGNTLLSAGVVVGAAATVYAVRCDTAVVSGALLVAAGPILSVSVHDLAHWVRGRAAGIRFLCYFLDGPVLIQPGLKTDYATYVRTPPTARASMHASGAIASKLAPLVPLGLWSISSAPKWAAWALGGFTLLQIVTDLTFSVRRSDWKKVRRELLVARAQESRRG